jgi:hypothetical protein
MSQRNPALPMSRSVRIFELFFDRYGRLTWIERSGRIYELSGIRFFYMIVAQLFGETVLPATRRLHGAASAFFPELTRGQICELRDRTLYYEISNLFIVIFYLPLIAMSFALHSKLVIYVATLACLHAILVGVERYKRALYSLCVEKLDFASHPDRAVSPIGPLHSDMTPSSPPKGTISAWYFTPRRFETERFYRALGLEKIRNNVITFTRITILPPEHRDRNPRSISGSAIDCLVAFDHETRVSEVTHLIGFLLQMPFLVLFLMRRAPLGVAYVLFLLWVNMSFILLQRATRVRLWRVLAKRRVSRQ